jgi:hypothetical protein
MEVNLETKYSAGDILYYIEGNNIKRTMVEGVAITIKEGPYYGDHTKRLEVKYYVTRKLGECIPEDAMGKEFFRSKTDILKHIAEQI